MNFFERVSDFLNSDQQFKNWHLIILASCTLCLIVGIVGLAIKQRNKNKIEYEDRIESAKAEARIEGEEGASKRVEYYIQKLIDSKYDEEEQNKRIEKVVQKLVKQEKDENEENRKHKEDIQVLEKQEDDDVDVNRGEKDVIQVLDEKERDDVDINDDEDN